MDLETKRLQDVNGVLQADLVQLQKIVDPPLNSLKKE
jgi:hypothetical protein